MMICYTKLLFQKNKGFTLIELILVLAIASIIFLPLYSILNLTSKTCALGEEKDELLLNARYGIEYVKNEIKSADIVVSADKIKNLKAKYPGNIGFLLVFIDGKSYKYVSYYSENGKLVRIACDSVEGKYPSSTDFSGHNQVCRLVEDVSTSRLDVENKMIYLDFNFKSNNKDGPDLNISSEIYIRCKGDY